MPVMIRQAKFAIGASLMRSQKRIDGCEASLARVNTAPAARLLTRARDLVHSDASLDVRGAVLGAGELG